VKQF